MRVTLEASGSLLRLEVRGGPARLPADFDYERQRHVGLGLELVSTLLVNTGCQLCFDQQQDEVCAILWLDAPAIVPRAAAS